MFILSLCLPIALSHFIHRSKATRYEDSLIVDVGYARYQGVQNATWGVNSWFGIRYASAPTGQLRWKPPQSIEASNLSSSELIEATNTGPICPQGYPGWRYNATPGSSTPVRGSEDCLLLDILTPMEPKSTALPVLLQIHGGGYTQGFAESSPGYTLVNVSNGNMIYVTIQYRLGAYGFLSSEEIANDGSANVGLLDQRAAITWTKDHIRAFGGDPDKITIIGGSAGGGSVMAQLIYKSGSEEPPFRAAIAEYPWGQQYRSKARLQTQYEILLSATGCEDLTCLRSLSEDDLLQGQQKAFLSAYIDQYGYGDFWFGPTLDGDIIRDLPSNELKNGHFSKVPLLTNRDGYEGYGYTNKSLNTTSGQAGLARLASDLKIVYPTFATSQSFLDRLLSLYPYTAYNSTFWQRSAIFSDVVVDCPSYYMASSLGDHVPTYKFIFRTGAQTHGADSPFLFNTTFGTRPGENITVANTLRDYYISFVTTLDPNTVSYTGVAKPHFPTYLASGNDTTLMGGKSFQVLEFNDTNIEARYDEDAGQKCDFFWSHNSIALN